MNKLDMFLIRAGNYVSASIDPFDILNGSLDSDLKQGETLVDKTLDSVQDPVKEASAALYLNELYILLRRNLFIIAACVVAVCLLKLLILKRPADTADKKMDIAHKLIIVFMAASLITILDMLYKIFASMV